MGAWRGNECGEPLDEGERVERHGQRAVTPMPFEPVDDAAVGGEGEALGRDGWAGDVAAEVLEPLEIAGEHEHLGVQGEVVVVGAQRSGQRRRTAREHALHGERQPRGAT